jgi:hypothetical protein
MAPCKSLAPAAAFPAAGSTARGHSHEHDHEDEDSAPAQQEGQAVVFAALVMLFLVPFLLIAVEIAARSLHRQQVEDALQQATRSAAQTFKYPEFAANQLTFRGEEELIGHARQILSINLRNLAGLAETPEQVAQRVHWEVLPSGGTCVSAEYTAPPGSPTICATLDVPMKSIVGWGTWSPHLVAAATLDHIK